MHAPIWICCHHDRHTYSILSSTYKHSSESSPIEFLLIVLYVEVSTDFCQGIRHRLRAPAIQHSPATETAVYLCLILLGNEFLQIRGAISFVDHVACVCFSFCCIGAR